MRNLSFRFLIIFLLSVLRHVPGAAADATAQGMSVLEDHLQKCQAIASRIATLTESYEDSKLSKAPLFSNSDNDSFDPFNSANDDSVENATAGSSEECPSCAKSCGSFIANEINKDSTSTFLEDCGFDLTFDPKHPLNLEFSGDGALSPDKIKNFHTCLKKAQKESSSISPLLALLGDSYSDVSLGDPENKNIIFQSNDSDSKQVCSAVYNYVFKKKISLDRIAEKCSWEVSKHCGLTAKMYLPKSMQADIKILTDKHTRCIKEGKDFISAVEAYAGNCDVCAAAILNGTGSAGSLFDADAVGLLAKMRQLDYLKLVQEQKQGPSGFQKTLALAPYGTQLVNSLLGTWQYGMYTGTVKNQSNNQTSFYNNQLNLCAATSGPPCDIQSYPGSLVNGGSNFTAAPNGIYTNGTNYNGGIYGLNANMGYANNYNNGSYGQYGYGNPLNNLFSGLIGGLGASLQGLGGNYLNQGYNTGGYNNTAYYSPYNAYSPYASAQNYSTPQWGVGPTANNNNAYYNTANNLGAYQNGLVYNSYSNTNPGCYNNNNYQAPYPQSQQYVPVNMGTSAYPNRYQYYPNSA